jgi:hypothetical protein
VEAIYESTEFIPAFSAQQSQNGSFMFHAESVPSNEKVVSIDFISAPQREH